jgi:hypothetical protein
MPDIERSTHNEAISALRSQREAYGRYSEIVSAQRSAVEKGNVRRMRGLADQLDEIIAEIEETGRQLAPVYQLVAGGQVDGPNTQAVRDMMTAVTADAALAQTNVRKLTQLLVAGRDETRRNLDSLNGGTGQSTMVGTYGAAQANLIDTRR